MAYDRTKDVNRRCGYLLQADLLALKDEVLPRARAIAALDTEGDPQDVAFAAYAQAKAEYEALNGRQSAALSS